MTKKHFISLANWLRYNHPDDFGPEQISALANWLQFNFPNFDRARWIDYVAGRCGPGGGKVKREAVEA